MLNTPLRFKKTTFLLICKHKICISSENLCPCCLNMGYVSLADAGFGHEGSPVTFAVTVTFLPRKHIQLNIKSTIFVHLSKLCFYFFIKKTPIKLLPDIVWPTNSCKHGICIDTLRTYMPYLGLYFNFH